MGDNRHKCFLYIWRYVRDLNEIVVVPSREYGKIADITEGYVAVSKIVQNDFRVFAYIVHHNAALEVRKRSDECRKMRSPCHNAEMGNTGSLLKDWLSVYVSANVKYPQTRARVDIRDYALVEDYIMANKGHNTRTCIKDALYGSSCGFKFGLVLVLVLVLVICRKVEGKYFDSPWKKPCTVLSRLDCASERMKSSRGPYQNSMIENRLKPAFLF
ncbi:hypothetical protein CYLTODRAFT_81955 [Cylindrobasidium torrendii FP15055 ss-10]|uniref:Uncharacterized protein n=1 Tax=Cylindrobasidium torrendii FP15055 ss-10 TaxID=1314674 RepID=A0A0D7B2T0_9AGAR|nr:hypothetical protein CYLTODRAFT_81955 [Cylindrobasidium torrendii FP15055 ss-10]